ncbi:hypothetical protein ADUPG1_009227 [Aduncisulcus paluster]|uniref:Uncharacterized protein n=1 Tax=Aduncisulcus paluster TaxID=2918883 RepID=A0ABQ5KXR5_9EUKA|nr:hypothetical protein ADUPG1_009227 [Aduncisulcus paluster]
MLKKSFSATDISTIKSHRKNGKFDISRRIHSPEESSQLLVSPLETLQAAASIADQLSSLSSVESSISVTSTASIAKEFAYVAKTIRRALAAHDVAGARALLRKFEDGYQKIASEGLDSSISNLSQYLESSHDVSITNMDRSIGETYGSVFPPPPSVVSSSSRSLSLSHTPRPSVRSYPTSPHNEYKTTLIGVDGASDSIKHDGFPLDLANPNHMPFHPGSFSKFIPLRLRFDPKRRATMDISGNHIHHPQILSAKSARACAYTQSARLPLCHSRFPFSPRDDRSGDSTPSTSARCSMPSSGTHTPSPMIKGSIPSLRIAGATPNSQNTMLSTQPPFSSFSTIGEGTADQLQDSIPLLSTAILTLRSQSTSTRTPREDIDKESDSIEIPVVSNTFPTTQDVFDNHKLQEAVLLPPCSLKLCHTAESSSSLRESNRDSFGSYRESFGGSPRSTTTPSSLLQTITTVPSRRDGSSSSKCSPDQAVKGSQVLRKSSTASALSSSKDSNSFCCSLPSDDPSSSKASKLKRSISLGNPSTNKKKRSSPTLISSKASSNDNSFVEQDHTTGIVAFQKYSTVYSDSRSPYSQSTPHKTPHNEYECEDSLSTNDSSLSESGTGSEFGIVVPHPSAIPSEEEELQEEEEEEEPRIYSSKQDSKPSLMSVSSRETLLQYTRMSQSPNHDEQPQQTIIPSASTLNNSSPSNPFGHDVPRQKEGEEVFELQDKSGIEEAGHAHDKESDRDVAVDASKTMSDADVYSEFNNKNLSFSLPSLFDTPLRHPRTQFYSSLPHSLSSSPQRLFCKVQSSRDSVRSTSSSQHSYKHGRRHSHSTHGHSHSARRSRSHIGRHILQSRVLESSSLAHHHSARSSAVLSVSRSSSGNNSTSEINLSTASAKNKDKRGGGDRIRVEEAGIVPSETSMKKAKNDKDGFFDKMNVPLERQIHFFRKTAILLGILFLVAIIGIIILLIVFV